MGDVEVVSESTEAGEHGFQKGSDGIVIDAGPARELPAPALNKTRTLTREFLFFSLQRPRPADGFRAAATLSQPPWMRVFGRFKRETEFN